MLSLPLLAFGLTHLTDARYFAAWNARYLCFSLGTADGLSLTDFLAIREWVEGPVCVAELGADAGAEVSPEELAAAGVSHLLLPYGTDAAPFRQAGIEVLTRIPVAGYHSVSDVKERLSETSGTILLDVADGGIAFTDLAEGSPFSLGELQRVLGDREAFLHLDIDVDEVDEAAAVLPGLALRGSSEEKVGYKSFDDLDDLLEALEA
ncbi:hypothetical protein [Lewinella sp. IMCC34183]|uniref:hypothetical protein n=1 Tax=Lewinella sp. IMCC34183 TaxID=2248762 RepID=UPI000E268445|nr:hypothetical protein [Lewinella sp. IMCC34183]